MTCFLFFLTNSLNRFCTDINSVHRMIVFTNELETNNCLHFVVALIDKSSNDFIATTSRKPTHTGFYSKWWSFVPLQKKRNFVNSLIRCAYDIPSSYELIHTEFVNIKRMLSRNVLPNNFWTDAFSNSLRENTGSHNKVTHRLNPLFRTNIFHYNYRNWPLHLTA